MTPIEQKFQHIIDNINFSNGEAWVVKLNGKVIKLGWNKTSFRSKTLAKRAWSTYINEQIQPKYKNVYEGHMCTRELIKSPRDIYLPNGCQTKVFTQWLLDKKILEFERIV